MDGWKGPSGVDNLITCKLSLKVERLEGGKIADAVNIPHYLHVNSLSLPVTFPLSKVTFLF